MHVKSVPARRLCTFGRKENLTSVCDRTNPAVWWESLAAGGGPASPACPKNSSLLFQSLETGPYTFDEIEQCLRRLEASTCDSSLFYDIGQYKKNQIQCTEGNAYKSLVITVCGRDEWMAERFSSRSKATLASFKTTIVCPMVVKELIGPRHKC